MTQHTIIHFPKTSSNIEHKLKLSHINDRKERVKNIILDLKPTSILDIGGIEYEKLCNNVNIKYTSVNINNPQKTGGVDITKILIQ